MDQQKIFHDLVSSESHRIRANLEGFLTESFPPEFRALAEQLIVEVGDISARVLLLEKAAEIGLLSSDPFAAGPLLNARITLDASKLCNDATWPVEHLPDGKPLCWTKEPTWQIALPLLRNRALLLCLNFHYIIKPSFLRRMTFAIDGVPLKHKVKKVDDEFMASIIVPDATSFSPSYIQLSLPEVCSPAELDQGDDTRELGIALMKITTRPATFVERLRHRS